MTAAGGNLDRSEVDELKASLSRYQGSGYFVRGVVVALASVAVILIIVGVIVGAYQVALLRAETELAKREAFRATGRVDAAKVDIKVLRALKGGETIEPANTETGDACESDRR